MTNKEISQAIRKALKEAGYTNKDYSIKSRYCGYSSSFDITIKNPAVRISEVEKIAKKWQSVDYDHATGEILMGGNDYVFVQYAYDVYDDVISELLPMAEKVFNNEKYSGKAIAAIDGKQVHINITGRNESILTEFTDTEEAYTYRLNYWIRSAKDLAIAIWRFKNIGTIYA